MKKISAFTLSIILMMITFTGCGEKSEKQLNKIAVEMCKAGTSALSESDCFFLNKISVYIDSDGRLFSDEYLLNSKKQNSSNAEKFINSFKEKFKNLDEYYWIARINVGDKEVTEIYVAESEDSKIIGTNGDSLDISDKSLNDICKELEKSGTFGIKPDEFEEKLNNKIKEFLNNDTEFLESNGTDSGISGYCYVYTDGTSEYKCYVNDYDYITKIYVNSIKYCEDAEDMIGTLLQILTPSIVIGDSEEVVDIKKLIMKIENIGMEFEETISDSSAEYCLYVDKYSQSVEITPKSIDTSE